MVAVLIVCVGVFVYVKITCLPNAFHCTVVRPHSTQIPFCHRKLATVELNEFGAFQPNNWNTPFLLCVFSSSSSTSSSSFAFSTGFSIVVVYSFCMPKQQQQWICSLGSLVLCLCLVLFLLYALLTHTTRIWTTRFSPWLFCGSTYLAFKRKSSWFPSFLLCMAMCKCECVCVL